MADIVRAHDGADNYSVSWKDNEGIVRERFFRSRNAAQRFALKIETELLNEAVEDIRRSMECGDRRADRSAE